MFERLGPTYFLIGRKIMSEKVQLPVTNNNIFPKLSIDEGTVKFNLDRNELKTTTDKIMLTLSQTSPDFYVSSVQVF